MPKSSGTWTHRCNKPELLSMISVIIRMRDCRGFRVEMQFKKNASLVFCRRKQKFQMILKYTQKCMRACNFFSHNIAEKFVIKHTLDCFCCYLRWADLENGVLAVAHRPHHPQHQLNVTVVMVIYLFFV